MVEQKSSSDDRTADSGGAVNESRSSGQGVIAALIDYACGLGGKYHECFNAHKWVQVASFIASLAFLSAISYLPFFR